MKSQAVAALTSIARKLRREMPDTEKYLWRHLRGKRFGGLKFKRQQPLGRYIVDFISLEKKLIIELDGGQHVANEATDQARDQWLRAQGFTVLRFWDNEVFGNLEGVLTTIQQHIL